MCPSTNTQASRQVLSYLMIGVLYTGCGMLCSTQAHALLQVVLCTPEPIEVPGVECVTYELEDLGVDNVAQILTSIAPQVMPHAARWVCRCWMWQNGDRRQEALGAVKAVLHCRFCPEECPDHPVNKLLLC